VVTRKSQNQLPMLKQNYLDQLLEGLKKEKKR